MADLQNDNRPGATGMVAVEPIGPVYRGQHCGTRALRTRHPTITFSGKIPAETYACHPNDRADTIIGHVLDPHIVEIREISCSVNPDPSPSP